MLITPSALARALYGSAGNLTVRRYRGRHVVERKRLSDAARLLAPPPYNLIFDNIDPGFTYTPYQWLGPWAQETAYGGSVHWLGTFNQTCWCQVGPVIPHEAQAKLYEWHPILAGTGSIRHIITHVNGADEVWVDQSVNGGQWNLLGTWTFSPTKAQVTLKHVQYQGFASIADAFRFEELT